MRVCLLTAVFPPALGGPATHVQQLAVSLRDGGHDVRVIALGDRSSASPTLQVIPQHDSKLRRAWHLYRALVALRGRCDVVYAHGAPWDVGWPALWARRALRVPVVFKVTGDNVWERARNAEWTADEIEPFQRRRYGWRVELLRWLQRRILRTMDHIVVPSRQLYAFALGGGMSTARITLIPNAIADLPIGVQSAARAAPLLVTVGRLTAWKGIGGILEAFVGVHHGATLEVIGDGPERERLTVQARALGLSGRVHFMGACSRDETLRRLAASDLCVLNSTYEGAPHVLLEALRLGVPVIGTRIPGIEQLITHGDTGWLVPPGDTRALHEAIAQLLSDAPLREWLGRRARAHAATLPSWADAVQRTCAVLAEVA